MAATKKCYRNVGLELDPTYQARYERGKEILPVMG